MRVVPWVRPARGARACLDGIRVGGSFDDAGAPRGVGLVAARRDGSPGSALDRVSKTAARFVLSRSCWPAQCAVGRP